MNALDLDEVRQYVNEHIDTFHESRILSVSGTRLNAVIRKNPYLLRAKNITKASELIDGALAARLSSSEEEMFGEFLEDLAIFVAERTTGGHKSGTTGVDLEFDDDGRHYFVSIKSGANWGNSSQQNKLETDLRRAVQVYNQRRGQRVSVDAVLGICYGKVRTARLRGYLKVVGQNFWTFISGNRNLYKDIIEPVGYRAREHNNRYDRELGRISNQLTAQFIEEYCHPDGSIDWEYLLEVTSGNFDLDSHGFNF